jgi:biopolymer transport protein ExbB/TolQ
MDTIAYYLTHPSALIYVTANALMYPVIILELVLLVFSVFEAGRFTVEMSMRRRRRSLPALRDLTDAARKALAGGDPEGAIAHLGEAVGTSGYGKRFAERLTPEHMERAHIVKLLDDTESEVRRRLERTRMLVRLGPILGLMGTLIPISPALVGLAQGDVQTLSDNLVVAFSTTVVGLLIGAIGYVVSTVRERKYLQDISDIEYALEITEL